jgi:hypothetical protein
MKDKINNHNNKKADANPYPTTHISRISTQDVRVHAPNEEL